MLTGEPPFWVLPGGGRKAGESDAEAVAREVRKELGVAVEVGVVSPTCRPTHRTGRTRD
jgi:8-oxo-dGTP pyrophosphatase MutT (NUDIX family)